MSDIADVKVSKPNAGSAPYLTRAGRTLRDDDHDLSNAEAAELVMRYIGEAAAPLLEEIADQAELVERTMAELTEPPEPEVTVENLGRGRFRLRKGASVPNPATPSGMTFGEIAELVERVKRPRPTRRPVAGPPIYPDGRPVHVK